MRRTSAITHPHVAGFALLILGIASRMYGINPKRIKVKLKEGEIKKEDDRNN